MILHVSKRLRQTFSNPTGANINSRRSIPQAKAVRHAAIRQKMVRQTNEDIRRHLTEQLQFLKNSAALYDRGNLAEAKRLAVPLRTLLHDTPKSTSILSQLDLKGLAFVDTAFPRPRRHITSYTGLIGTVVGTGPAHVPHLDAAPSRLLPFDEWWNAPVIVDSAQREISRMRLVLEVCNRDGGAHVDPELAEIYADLSRHNSLGRVQSTSRGWQPALGAEFATIRQIAHETLKTMDPTYKPEELPESDGFVIAGFDITTAPPKPVSPQIQRKVRRNDPCPCGSRKKFKKCCGRLAT
jgi:hypothetical protein